MSTSTVLKKNTVEEHNCIEWLVVETGKYIYLCVKLESKVKIIPNLLNLIKNALF